jgi:preprotein translocase subunit SecD
VSNADVESAWVERAESGCQVGIRLTGEGAEKLARLTENHIGDRLALVIDGEVVMTPTIRSKVESLGLLTGDFSDSRCEEIARGLSAGS